MIFLSSFSIGAYFLPRVPVGKRANLTKVQSKGFFPGAQVTRGRDWKWDDQDGGSGRVGRLTDITAWSGIVRSGAKVTWNPLVKNQYRIGHQGSVSILLQRGRPSKWRGLCNSRKVSQIPFTRFGFLGQLSLGLMIMNFI